MDIFEKGANSSGEGSGEACLCETGEGGMEIPGASDTLITRSLLFGTCCGHPPGYFR